MKTLKRWPAGLISLTVFQVNFVHSCRCVIVAVCILFLFRSKICELIIMCSVVFWDETFLDITLETNPTNH